MANTTELKNFNHVSLSETGQVRTKNEDYLGYFDTINGHVFVICDGMGGYEGGEIASKITVNSLKFFFSNFYYTNVFKALADAVGYAHKQLKDEAWLNPRLARMGTTLLILLIRNNQLFYVHLGDTRLYIYRKNKLLLLTKDHTVAQQMLDRNEITAQQADQINERNVLHKSLSVFETHEPEICQFPFIPEKDDLLLLCTDGLYNEIEKDRIATFLKKYDGIEATARNLMNTALNHGGKDNISFHLIHFYNLPVKQHKATKKRKYLILNTKNALKIAAILVVAFVLNVIYQNYSFKTINSVTFIKTQNNPDYINVSFANEAELNQIYLKYNLEQAGFNKDSLKNLRNLKIPVKAMHKTRFYDNIKLLSVLYKIPDTSITRANDIILMHPVYVEELLIPLH